MKFNIYNKMVMIVWIALAIGSCDDLVEVDAPGHRMVSESVFDNDQTAIAAMNGIYYELFNKGFSSGGTYSITYLSSLSSDEMDLERVSYEHSKEFYENALNPDNQGVYWLWTSAYETIYMVNSLLEGLNSSSTITPELGNRLEGEAKFVRAFSYFYLVNLYGETPLLLTTDYERNALAGRNSIAEVYDQIILDLEDARSLLDETYMDGERTQVNHFVATALLARVHLFLKNWELAERFSSEVINASGTYGLIDDLDDVFLANSREAIWQISPYGLGYAATQTNEGNIFIIDPDDPFAVFFMSVVVPKAFYDSLLEDDLRRQHWMAYNPNLEFYYPHKYKIGNSTGPIEEYSMVMRLAEQYFIRAEARTMQGNIPGGIADLDVIRGRAGLPLFADTDPGIDADALIGAILKERRIELHTEWGHRWLDLKRTDRATEVLEPLKDAWEPTDVLYPIPGDERMKNPNLSQNDGY